MTHATLHDLYAQHRGNVSDKWSNYLREYDRLFSSLRDTPVRLLEIGVRSGGSLEIWSRYFPAASHLVGCNIDPACATLTYDDPRISVVVGDADSDTTEAAIAARCPQFDLIIDDGSHRAGDIVRAFARYFARLADGGLFVASDWQTFQDGLHDPALPMEFFKRLADLVTHEHRGIDRSRKSLLENFSRAHGFDIDEEVLAHVHAVEFTDSICVVRRQAPASNLLGEREAAPAKAAQASEAQRQILQLQVSLSQSQASLQQAQARASELQSSLRRAQEELAMLNARFVEQRRQLSVERVQRQQMTSSLLWRLDAPRRYLQSLNHARLDARRQRRLAAAAAKSGGQPARDYAAWVREYDTIDDDARTSMRRRIDAMTAPPVISVLMPTYNANPSWLRAAIESVREQIYPHWELCIADDASTSPEAQDMLRAYTDQDARIKVVFRTQNGHISAASNSALALATGAWIALMDHDDLLPEHALFWVAHAIDKNPDLALIYSDEDKIDEVGTRSTPYFKSDWNQDLFYSQNMFSHLGVYRSELVRRVGGFREGFEGSQDYDLALRCVEQVSPAQIHHIPEVLYHWRTHPQSTARSTSVKPYAAVAGERALNEHFIRCGVRATSEFVGHGYRTRYALPVDLPLVSLIIPTRNALALLRQCISSLTERTRYQRYEIIVVDNGSDAPETLAYLEQAKARGVLRVIRDDGEFNYSALNNRAAEQANGEIIGLLNNDIEIVSPDWLSEMVSIALQRGVGAVGARLWYPDKTLQHGGVLLGVGGVANHAHRGCRPGDIGFFSRAVLTQSFSAVTGACLIVRKEHYLAVGGLNEVDLKVAFNDVDFCLRLRERGLRNVWTPYAELIHHESATRGADIAPERRERFVREVGYMTSRWGDLLRFDPAYNPNLTLDSGDFGLAWPPRVRPDLTLR